MAAALCEGLITSSKHLLKEWATVNTEGHQESWPYTLSGVCRAPREAFLSANSVLGQSPFSIVPLSRV
jgi:hypothetical protein